MTEKNPDPSHIRLAKRVAEQLNCSRSTAEQFIEGGFVSVDGQVVEAPGSRVRPGQAVTVAQDASLLELTPVTLLLHKPTGFEAGLGLPADQAAHASRSQGAPQAVTLLSAASHLAEDASGIRVLQRHFKQLECFTPKPFTLSLSKRRAMLRQAQHERMYLIAALTGTPLRKRCSP